MTLVLDDLHAFIIEAKACTYVGNGAPVLSHRPGSHDLEHHRPPFAYLDSYYGGADFIGEEAVYFEGQPVWAMNYYGRILRPDLIGPAEAGQIIKASLTALYVEQRFLGGFRYETHDSVYYDTNDGDFTAFTGLEWIERGGARVYELHYHGGLIK